MNIKDPKNSVHVEQFGEHSENTDSESQNTAMQSTNPVEDKAGDEVKKVKEPKVKVTPNLKPDEDINAGPVEGEVGMVEPEKTGIKGKTAVEEKVSTEEEEKDDKAEVEAVETEVGSESGEEVALPTPEEHKEEIAEDTTVEEEVVVHAKDKKTVEDQTNKNIDKKKESADDSSSSTVSGEDATVNYNLLSREDLVSMLDDLVSGKNITDIRDDVEIIKIAFYKKQRAEIDEAKESFIAGGGSPDEFQSPEDSEEERFKELLKRYRDLKSDLSRVDDNDKESNLKEKYRIIDEIKELLNRDESINKTFQEFRELQKRWHDVGVVPQQSLKDLWENYHYHVEKFYDYIKINKELRDLDLKKNLEAKIGLCEKAEALLLEPNVVNAFQTLQKFHDQWREIGPVPKEKRTEIWERFRDATSKINKKHQSYYQELKESQKKNLESKTVLCDKAEELALVEPENHDEWVKKTNEMMELQKVWKTIGFAPKKDNNRIYARFRSACDKFFEKKREFYAHNMEEQQNHLQQKLDLCIQAESLQDSTDWKITTDELIRLQRKWKGIGPVPRKNSDEVWKRFRAACDKFFTRKADFFSKIDSTYENNLKSKEELIEEISAFKLSDNQKQNLKQLNDFQRRWSEIGFVPFEKKDEIMQKFRVAINKHYDNLELDDHRKSMLKFRNKIDTIRQKPRPEVKMRFEREKLMNKLQQLKSDISLWENNIGFFANTQNAGSMVRDFEQKIVDAKEKMTLLEEKIILIDDLDGDED